MSLFRNENPILGVNAKVRSKELGTDVKLIPTEYVSTELVAASPATGTHFWVAPYPCQVTAVKEIHSVVGGAAAAVKVRKIIGDGNAPNAAAGANVKELHTATFDLTASANVLRAGTLVSTVADLQLNVGDRLAYSPSGTLTGLIGYLQVELKKI